MFYALRRLGDIAKSHLKEAHTHTHTITEATINDDDVIWLPTSRVCLPLWMVCCLVVTLPQAFPVVLVGYPTLYSENLHASTVLCISDVTVSVHA